MSNFTKRRTSACLLTKDNQTKCLRYPDNRRCCCRATFAELYRPPINQGESNPGQHYLQNPLGHAPMTVSDVTSGRSCGCGAQYGIRPCSPSHRRRFARRLTAAAARSASGSTRECFAAVRSRGLSATGGSCFPSPRRSRRATGAPPLARSRCRRSCRAGTNHEEVSSHTAGQQPDTSVTAGSAATAGLRSARESPRVDLARHASHSDQKN